MSSSHHNGHNHGHNDGHDHSHGGHDGHSHETHGQSSAMESGIPLILLVVVLAAAIMFYTSTSFPVSEHSAAPAAAHGEAKH